MWTTLNGDIRLISMTFKFMDKLPVKETDIQRQIIRWLYKAGIFCWRNNSMGVFDPKLKIYRKPNGEGYINGVSDILGVVKGKMLAIEVKKPGGRISTEQKEFIERLSSDGHVAFVAYSLDDVIAEFQKRGIISSECALDE